jgi:hypothetical protein
MLCVIMVNVVMHSVVAPLEVNEKLYKINFRHLD